MPLNINLNVDDVQVVSSCAEILVYWRGSVYERVDAVMNFYRGAMQGVRPLARWYETESMGEVRPVTEKTFDLLPRWLKEPKASRGMMALMVESGENAASSSDLSFSIFCDEEDAQPMGYVRLVTPCQVLDHDPGLFLQTAVHLIGSLDFEFGTGGYAISWDRRSELSTVAERHVARIASTFPGVEIPDPNTTLIALQSVERPALKRIGWLTFLGQGLGDAARLQALGDIPGVEEIGLGKGICIAAGSEPRRSGDMRLYRAVGSKLAHQRVPEHAPLFGQDDEPSDRWLAAFD
jgi:Protein of unknown function (DUF3396)